MDENVKRDEELFKALRKKKRKKRRRTVFTVLIIVLIIAAVVAYGYSNLRHRVENKVAEDAGDVSSAEVKTGSISTTVSGSGTLENVDIEQLSIPEGVDVDEMLVSVNDRVEEGDIIATVDSRTVLAAMSSVQEDIIELDKKLNSAGSDYVDEYISTGVPGRVKAVYAQVGDDVAGVMYKYGSLAELSLDGYMAVDIGIGDLRVGDSVAVIRADGSEISGLVQDIFSGSAVVVVSDDGPMKDEKVTVRSLEGVVLGEGELYIHSPLRITGVAGTVNAVYVTENQKLYNTGLLYTLTNTEYKNNFNSILKERKELEKTLQKLLALHQDGGLAAPYAGTICSVEYSDEEETTVTTTTTTTTEMMSSYSAFFGGSGTDSSRTGTSSSATASSTASTAKKNNDTDMCTICPDLTMDITVNVDESHILSLEVGQGADVTISSIGEEVFEGTVKKISRAATTSSSGVTKYSAVISVDKTEKMLSGMSASVVIRIEGKENALIIPVDALHQTSSTSFVYTGYNNETHEFEGMVEVTTGVSNSNNVEILSGLNEGDTVWYTPKKEDFFSMMSRMASGGSMSGMTGGMGGMSGGGSRYGGMPGGDMPDRRRGG